MRYVDRWSAVQLRFVDEPEATLAEADDLVVQVMAARGYPVDDPDERTGMVVADHPELAGDYRTAHAIRRRSDGGEATLDELREGFQHYRALFSRLLDDAAGGDQDGDRRVARAPERERDPVRGREPVGPARSRSPGQRARRHARG